MSLASDGASGFFGTLPISSLSGTYEYLVASQVTQSDFNTESGTTYGGTFTVSSGLVTAQNSTPPATPTVRAVHQMSLDRWGNSVSITDPASGGVTYGYFDDQNRSIKGVAPAVAVWNGLTGMQTAASPTEFVYYDSLGRVIGATDANGNLDRTYYDAAGDKVKELKADTSVWTWSYDVLGRQVQARDGVGGITNYSYDQRDQLVTQDQNGYAGGDRITSYTYDELGNRTSTAVAAGQDLNLLTRQLYDTRGNVVSVLSPLTIYSAGNDAQAYVSYGYDYLGRKTSVTNALDRRGSETWLYDYFGRLTQHTDAGGSSYSYTYDALGRLYTETNTPVAQSVSISGTGGNSNLSGSVSNVQVNLTYLYYDNGWLKTIADAGTGGDATLTTYQYDLDGRHTLEQLSDSVNGTVRQNTRIVYDAMGRVLTLQDSGDPSGGNPGYTMSYGYDAAGNRIRVYAQYGSPTTQDNWYQYDAADRMTLAAGQRTGSAGAYTVAAGSSGTVLGYDANGQRKTATSGGKLQLYSYQPDGQLTETQISNDGQTTDAVPSSMRIYDQAGRMVEYDNYWGNGSTAPQDRRTMSYNAAGELISQSDYGGGTTVLSQVNYSASGAGETGNALAGDMGWYDGVSNATQYTAASYDGYSKLKYTETFQFDYIGVGDEEKIYQEEAGLVVPNGGSSSGSYAPGTSTWSYDSQGNNLKITNPSGTITEQDFTYDESGHIVWQSSTQPPFTEWEDYYYANGNPIGRAGPLSGNNFDQNYQPVSQAYPASDAGQYVVESSTDTLQSIALSQYGDSSLWYVIADANGLSSSQSLSPGQVLTIPSVVTNLHNNAGTFKPYSTVGIVQDATPVPKYVPPAPPPGHHQNCRALTNIIGAVVQVVVQMVVSAFTGSQQLGAMAGAMAGYASRAESGAIFNGDFNYKEALLSSLHLSVIDTLVEGGSLKDAFVHDAIGGIDPGIAGVKDFDYRGWLIAGASAFIGSYAGGASGLGGLGSRIMSGVVTNITQQSLGLAFHEQSSFDFGGFAGAVVSAGMPGASGSTGSMLGDFAQSFASNFINGAASEEVSNLVDGRGGFDWSSVAAESFGSALGQSIADPIAYPRMASRVSPLARAYYDNAIANGATPTDAYQSAMRANQSSLQVVANALGWSQGGGGASFSLNGGGSASAISFGDKSSGINLGLTPNLSDVKAEIDAIQISHYGEPGGAGATPATLQSNDTVAALNSLQSLSAPFTPLAGPGQLDVFGGTNSFEIGNQYYGQNPSTVQVTGPKPGFVSAVLHNLENGEFGHAWDLIANKFDSGVNAVENFFTTGGSATEGQTLRYMLSQVDQRKVPIQVHPGQIVLGVGQGAWNAAVGTGIGIVSGLGSSNATIGSAQPTFSQLYDANTAYAVQHGWIITPRNDDQQLGQTIGGLGFAVVTSRVPLGEGSASVDESVAARSAEPVRILPQSFTREDLGDLLGSGAEKNVYALRDHPDLVVGLPKDGYVQTAMREGFLSPIATQEEQLQYVQTQFTNEVAALNKLDSLGLPVVRNYGTVSVDGQPGILLERIPDAVSSKDIFNYGNVQYGAVDGADISRLNANSIQDLQSIRAGLLNNNVNVNDLQFLFRQDGHVVINDPLSVGFYGPSQEHLDTIDALIKLAQGNGG